MARRMGKARRTRHRAGRTGAGPSRTPPAAARVTGRPVEVTPGTTLEDISDLRSGEQRRLACGCSVHLGADGHVDLRSPPAQRPGRQERVRDGVMDGIAMFGAAGCAEFDRVAPDEARRFREVMGYGPDWRVLPGASRGDDAARDAAFLDMTAPGASDERRAELAETLRRVKAEMVAVVRASRAMPRGPSGVGLRVFTYRFDGGPTGRGPVASA